MTGSDGHSGGDLVDAEWGWHMSLARERAGRLTPGCTLRAALLRSLDPHPHFDTHFRSIMKGAATRESNV